MNSAHKDDHRRAPARSGSTDPGEDRRPRGGGERSRTNPNAQGRRATRIGQLARGRGQNALVAACLLGSVALAGAAGARAESAGAAPTIQTDSGAVVGKTEGNTVQFLGIPYAAPSAGALRFRPPQPRAPWSAPLQATEFGSLCPQTPRLGSLSANEDCLFLNVLAPARGPGGRPVMVFIHGGSFTAGSGDVPLSGPTTPARRSPSGPAWSSSPSITGSASSASSPRRRWPPRTHAVFPATTGSRTSSSRCAGSGATSRISAASRTA